MRFRYAVAVLALATPSLADAQSLLGNLLRSAVQASQQQQRQKEQAMQQQQMELQQRQALLDKISQTIRINPDAACGIAEPDIRNWFSSEVNKNGLMDDIDRTVFGVNGKPRPLTALEKLSKEVNEETQRKFARDQAMYRARDTGGEVPVGQEPVAQGKTYNVSLQNIAAVSRIQGGLTCKADAAIEHLRVQVAYTFTLDPGQSDGWNATFINTPVFTVAAALDPSSGLRVDYGGRDMTLDEARMRSSVDQADATAQQLKEQRQADAEQAYRQSTAGQAAARRQRQAMAVRQRQCEAHGGTWGYNDGQTVYRMDAATETGLFAQFQACYFLGK